MIKEKAENGVIIQFRDKFLVFSTPQSYSVIPIENNLRNIDSLNNNAQFVFDQLISFCQIINKSDLLGRCNNIKFLFSKELFLKMIINFKKKINTS